MATSRYRIQIHQRVNQEDLPGLTDELREIFEDVCQSVLILDPYRCLGLSSHGLKGKLQNHRAVELDWIGVAYRLVDRIYDKPAPKRVVVLSFSEHDPAYERAIARRFE